jgi:hypothetical protein
VCTSYKLHKPRRFRNGLGLALGIGRFQLIYSVAGYLSEGRERELRLEGVIDARAAEMIKQRRMNEWPFN